MLERLKQIANYEDKVRLFNPILDVVFQRCTMDDALAIEIAICDAANQQAKECYEALAAVRAAPHIDTDRYYFGDEGTERAWRQCKVCLGYADDVVGNRPVVEHKAFDGAVCPVGVLERSNQQPASAERPRDPHHPDCEQSAGQAMRGDYTPTDCTCRVEALRRLAPGVVE